MPRIAVNGVELAYEVEGSGPPVVLVHGSWSDRHGWDRVVDGLARSFTVVRYDRRGHSESGPATGTTRDDVADLAALIERLELAPAHVVASSFGGVIAFHLAASSPGLVRSVVSHEPPAIRLIPDDHPERGAVDEASAGEGAVCDQIDAGDHEGAARRFVDEVAFAPGTWERLPEPMRATMIRNAATFPEERRDPESRWLDLVALRAFHRPVLLTRGTVGPEWYGAVIDRIADAVRDPHRHVFEGAGHMPQATHPDDYVEVVTAFLRKADARVGAAPDQAVSTTLPR